MDSVPLGLFSVSLFHFSVAFNENEVNKFKF